MNTQSNEQSTTDTPAGSAAKSTPGRQRRFAMLGVTAGLLGGGAIGLLAATPSYSSASSITTSVGTAAAEPTDDTATTSTSGTTAGAGATDTADRAEPSVGLRAALQTMVDDGTISAAQADAVAEHLASIHAEMEGPMGRGHHHGGGGRIGADGHPGVLAELLGLEVTDVRTAIEGGSTIAELAEANGVDLQTVIDGLVVAANARIDEAVADGRLTEEEAASKRAELVTRITEGVNTAHPLGGRPG